MLPWCQQRLGGQDAELRSKGMSPLSHGHFLVRMLHRSLPLRLYREATLYLKNQYNDIVTLHASRYEEHECTRFHSFLHMPRSLTLSCYMYRGVKYTISLICTQTYTKVTVSQITSNSTCLFDRLLGMIIKKASNFIITRNPGLIRGFPSQRASDVENIQMS